MRLALRTASLVSAGLVTALLVNVTAASGLAAEDTPALWRITGERPLKDLLEVEQEATAAKDTDQSVAFQRLAFVRSTVGDYLGAIEAFAEAMGPSRNRLPAGAKNAKEAVDGCLVLPALAAIVREAQDRQVVILNEAHHISRHRAFA